MTTTEKPMPQSLSPRLKGALFLVLALLAVFLLLEGDGNRSLSSTTWSNACLTSNWQAYMSRV